MPQHDHTDNDSSEADKKNSSAPKTTIRAKPFGLRWIVIGGCTAFIALLFISIFLPYLTERVKFFTVNFLSLLVLTIIAVQALIYRRQWEAMQGQLDAMRESLAETRNIVIQNERAVIASEAQAIASEASARAAEQTAQIIARSFSIAERPYIGVKTMRITNFTAGQRPMIHVIFENAGRTPAFNVVTRVYTFFNVEPKLLDEVEYRDVPIASKAFLMAGAPQETILGFVSTTFDQKTTDKLIGMVQRKEYNFFVYGLAEYDDGINNHHTLKFCYFFDPASSTFKACREHNSSD